MHPSPSEPEVVAALRLHLATLYRPTTAARALERCGSPLGIFRSSRDELASVFPSHRSVADRLLSQRWQDDAERELALARREGIDILVRGTCSYPPPLQSLPSMPLVLFSRGRLDGSSWPSVAIVGSRRPSVYGLRQTRRFARFLAEVRVAVVSGLARGVDAAAHHAALKAGGTTLAVLGSGLGAVYPPEHRSLAHAIVAGGQGAVLSEFPFTTPPRSFHFPQRNRVLSGLGTHLLVVEASERSGSLITVDWALRQGRTVFVVPGRVDEPEAAGALSLLRDGASPALEPADLLVGDLQERARWPSDRPDQNRHADVAPIPGPRGAQLEALFSEKDAWHVDDLSSRIGGSGKELLVEIARLELDGHLRRLPDGRLTRS